MQKRIGEFLRDKGVISEAEMLEILNYARNARLRYGDAGLELGILTPEKLRFVFGPNYRVDFFHLIPEFLPAITRDLFSIHQILRFGVLPLGFKTEFRMFRSRRILNLGMLDPRASDGVHTLESEARTKLGKESFHGVKIFLILADQFVDTLEAVYGIDREALRAACALGELDGTLSRYIESRAASEV